MKIMRCLRHNTPANKLSNTPLLAGKSMLKHNAACDFIQYKLLDNVQPTAVNPGNDGSITGYHWPHLFFFSMCNCCDLAAQIPNPLRAIILILFFKRYTCTVRSFQL